MGDLSLRSVILRIFRNIILLELALLIVIGIIIRGKLNANTGGILFFVGIFCGIVAGLTAGGVRQGGWYNPLLMRAEKVLTEKDLDSGAKGRRAGTAGFLKAYSKTVTLGVMCVLNIIFGIVITSIFQ